MKILNASAFFIALLTIGAHYAHSRTVIRTINPSLVGSRLQANINTNSSGDSRCQSSNLCLYAQMPILRQSDPALASFIASRIGENPNTFKDKGWCVPASSAMIMSGIMKEKDQQTTSLTGFLNGVPFASAEQNIFTLGNRLGTNWREGGTRFNNVWLAYNDFFKFSRFKDYELKAKNVTTWDRFFDSFGEFPHSDLVNSIKNNKKSFHAVILKTVKKEKRILWVKVNWYEADKNFEHAVAVNGVENNYLKIFDPWGSIHSAQTSVESMKMNPLWSQKVTVIKPTSGSTGPHPVGFIGQVTNGFKVPALMTQVIEIDAN